MPADRQVRLSAIVIAQNESERIAAALQSLAFADEIIVIDGGSTDDTVALATQAGARVLHNPWPGFAAQVRFAMTQATGDWVFRLDADELVPPALAAEITATLQRPEQPEVAYWVPRQSSFYGRLIRHCGLYPDAHVRLWRAGSGTVPEQAVHEAFVPTDPQAPVGRLRSEITHYPWRDLDDMISKAMGYSKLQAQDAIRSGRRRCPALLMLVALPRKFGEMYLLKGGILDGYQGLIIAAVHAFQVFVRECRIWLHQSGLSEAPSGPPTDGSQT